MAKESQQTSNKPITGDMLELLDLLRDPKRSWTVNGIQTETLDFLLRAFECPCGQFILALKSGESLDLERIVSQGISSDFVSAFRSHYHMISPFHPPPLDLDRSAVTGAELVEWNRLIEMSYYVEFLKPLSIAHQLIFLLKSDQRLLGAIYLYRYEDAHQFSSSDIAKAEVIIPYLITALDQAYLKEWELGWISTLDSLADDLPYRGLLLISPSIEVIYANSFARMALCAQVGQLREDIISFPLPDEFSSRCRTLIENKESEILTDLTDFRFCTPPGGQDLAVHLRRLPVGGQTSFVLVTLHEIAPVFSLSQELKDIGISLRELDVILFVYQGLQNSEIALRLVISEHTVENHLRSIYEKMEVNSRTGLIHRIIEMGGGTSRLIPIQDFPSM